MQNSLNFATFVQLGKVSAEKSATSHIRNRCMQLFNFGKNQKTSIPTFWDATH